MLKTTFYSYKGGVGRTLAMCNVAYILARAGRRVVIVDLDLEAPGVGLSRATGYREGEAPTRGVSDFLLKAREGANPDLKDFVTADEELGESLLYLSAGHRAMELAGLIPSLYADLKGDDALLFRALDASLRHDLDEPDYVFFDSRTGFADIAGVCTIELPDVLVTVCGLNDQNVYGMKAALERIRNHPVYVNQERERPPILSALSPIPVKTLTRSDDGLVAEHLDGRSLSLGQPHEFKISFSASANVPFAQLPFHDQLIRRLRRAYEHIWAPLQSQLAPLRRRGAEVDASDLFHTFNFDPRISLGTERVPEAWPLHAQYERLALALTRLNPQDTELEHNKKMLSPLYFLEALVDE